MIHPDDIERTKAKQREIGVTKAAYEIEYRLHHAKSGQHREVLARGVPLFDAQGRVFEWAGSITDVHHQRQAEAALRASEARLRALANDLEVRVAERTAELKASLEERAQAEAALAQSQRLETVGRLTGGVAHDFNNLLTVILGGLDMILRAPEKVERVKRLAEAAIEAGQRGERLTRQLLAFSRRQELKLEAVDLQALLARAEPLIRRAVKETVTLEIRTAGDAGWATVDAAQFESALLNLVVNAADAVSDTGVIRVEASKVVLQASEVPETQPGEHVRVRVSDDGVGMSPEVMARVFEPFFTTKETGKGTGLGLAQVYGFVRQCGGGVRIESEPGKGTSISLYLPSARAGEEPAAAHPKAAAAAPFGRDRTVLLAEDDPAVRMVTEGLLLEFGCRVVSAADGHEALAMLRAEPGIDMLVSDILMPGGMTGVDLAREASALRPDLPIVLATGYAGDRLDVAAEAGWPVLRKPYRVEDLAAAVRAGLDRTAGPRIEGR
jgi:signal transduction histidine kinase/CheY-like chemotaxis protein